MLSARLLARSLVKGSSWLITRSRARSARRQALEREPSTSTRSRICPSEAPEQLGGTRKPGQLSDEWDTFYTSEEGWTAPGLTDLPSYYDEGRGGHTPRPDLYFRILGEAWPDHQTGQSPAGLEHSEGEDS
jgi:hypothetical protein